MRRIASRSRSEKDSRTGAERMRFAHKRPNARSRRAQGQAKSELVPIVERSWAAVQPSLAKDRLYRPVSDSDPDIIALAESIRQCGLQEPIVVTRDNFILSGHRRHRACRLAGLTVIPCRVENILSTDPSFLARLCEFNRQRVKSI